MGEVHFVSTSLVTSSSNHPIPRIDLNPWDLQTLIVGGIQKGLFFSNPSNTQLQTLKQHFSTENLIQHLKISLSQTLSFFPPLAGRFSASKNDDNTTSFSINCNNEGAEFTHAIAKGVTIADALDPSTNYTPQILQSFFPLNGVLNYEGLYKPLFGAQVTELEDGIFIGCTMNHTLGDGTAFWDFFNSWSEISRGLSSISKSPVFPRWFPDDLTNFSSVPISLLEKQTQQKLNTVNTPIIQEKVFHFIKENIAKLKSKAYLENTTEITISSFQAVISHLWRSVIRCSVKNPIQDGVAQDIINSPHRSYSTDVGLYSPDQEVVLKLVVSSRGRIQPFLPEGYFGNAYIFTSLKSTSHNLLQNPLSWASLEINKVIGSHTSESMKKGYIDMVNEPKILRLSGLIEEGHVLMITSSARHRVYTVDFGWGKALAVRSGGGNKKPGKVTMFPGREDGSIDMEVCLSLETMVALEKDLEFIEVFKL